VSEPQHVCRQHTEPPLFNFHRVLTTPPCRPVRLRLSFLCSTLSLFQFRRQALRRQAQLIAAVSHAPERKKWMTSGKLQLVSVWNGVRELGLQQNSRWASDGLLLWTSRLLQQAMQNSRAAISPYRMHVRHRWQGA
jgi:hypothetical protein